MNSLLQKLKYAMARFLYGRNGVDQLNTALLAAGVVLSLIGMIAKWQILTVLAYVPLILAIYRTYSRDLTLRRRENQKFLALVSRAKDRDNRYFTCPKCRQSVRVPRGKGKIKIHCPKCGEQFVKKT